MVGRSRRADKVRAVPRHSAPLLDRAEPRSNFDAALLALLDLSARSGATGLRDGRRARILAALDYQASWEQIKNWRRARRRVPQWAKDKLQAKLLQRAARTDHSLALLRHAE